MSAQPTIRTGLLLIAVLFVAMAASTVARDTKTELTIDGTKMSGSSEGPAAARTITLNKQK